MNPSSQPFEHEPVMVDLIVDLFGPVPAGTIVDATVGGAGHAAALLDAHPHVRVAGLDRDPDAVEAAATRLRRFGDRATVHHARFDAVRDVVAALGLDGLSGALFDLGVSSHQLDTGERGFSHRADAPLDMRMDPTRGPTAADVVNGYEEAELARILRTHGDERYATRIARAIVAARPITTTGRLVEVIRDAIPAPARRRGGHPATRSFQAVRIEVNDELAVLQPALEQAIALLVPGGRCAVLAYHSGEDRIVKSTFRDAATGGCTCPPGLPCGCGAVPTVRLLKRGAWKASADEVARNRRSESARLRAVEKLAS
ncbi:MAG TPA: 16S rRNA (cytosine(1402)-N(4))-methyltransferase RsmH [Acidimicrobiales bacterium]|nr:16S rRNA (cytosine(1402)-N(4))-methyltransferase RsmH [Acidimicrobiales bacterium]